jgi:hypothetical protein
MKLGKCLKNALKYIDDHPTTNLRLVQGPPGQSGDTSHFWLLDKNDEVIDPTPEAVSKGYEYKGRIVDHKKVREELKLNEDIQKWARKIKGE